MASAGVWGALPQSEVVAHSALEAIDRVSSYRSVNQISDTNTSETSNTPEIEKEEGQISRLARQLTLRSVQNSDGTYANPFNGSNDPALNPRSGQFKHEVWTKTLIGFVAVPRS